MYISPYVCYLNTPEKSSCLSGDMFCLTVWRQVLPKGKEGLLPYSLINDADKLTMVYSQLKIAQNLQIIISYFCAPSHISLFLSAHFKVI